MQTINPAKKYLLGLSRSEIMEFVKAQGMAAYRADQIYKGIYVQRLADFGDLTTLSKSDRLQLNENTILRTLGLDQTTRSDLDRTTKFLWSMPDGAKIESVIIYEDKRITFCISSQVGCALDCQFCTTGKMGFTRNLTSGEIVEQVMLMNHLAARPATNIVFMGMGEPLMNVRNVLKACTILSDPEGLAFSRKKITISTSGVAPAIKKLADENVPFSLAVSLNAVFEEKRKQIMPVSDHFPLDMLMESIRYYVQKMRKRISFEYIMIKDFNDTREDADRLIKLTSRIPCKINLIPCNSTDPAYPPSPAETVTWFADYLHNRGRTATTRLRKGWEIQAACGQLYAKIEKRKGRKITDYR
jgi:23S rRNA (adenine2503-C2)-methyltransferase